MPEVKEESKSRNSLVKRLKFVAGIQAAQDDRDDILEAIKILSAPVSELGALPPVAWMRSTPSGPEFSPYRGTLLDDAGWTRLYTAPNGRAG